MSPQARRRGPATLLSAALTACGALSPDPEEIASALPPERELNEAAAARLEGLTAEAMALVEAGDHVGAEEAARQALRIQPRAARPRGVLGTCLMRRALLGGRPPDLRLWRQAEGELLAATRADPADPWVAVLYGRFLLEDGHLTAAAEVAEAALGHDGEDLAALRLAAEARYELGEERLARPHLTRLAQRAPDALNVYRLAWCLLRLADGDPDNAVPLLQEAAEGFAAYRELEPGDVEGYLAEGRVWLRAAEEAGDDEGLRARAQRAWAVYEQAADRFPDAVAPPFGCGLALELLGEADRAVQAYERALELDPDHTGALLNLVALHAEAGRREQAELLCRRALEQADLTRDERRRLLEYLSGGAPQAPMML